MTSEGGPQRRSEAQRRRGAECYRRADLLRDRKDIPARRASTIRWLRQGATVPAITELRGSAGTKATMREAVAEIQGDTAHDHRGGCDNGDGWRQVEGVVLEELKYEAWGAEQDDQDDGEWPEFRRLLKLARPFSLDTQLDGFGQLCEVEPGIRSHAGYKYLRAGRVRYIYLPTGASRTNRIRSRNSSSFRSWSKPSGMTLLGLMRRSLMFFWGWCLRGGRRRGV